MSDGMGFMFVEAGPDTRGAPPARHWAVPLWIDRMKPLLVAGIAAVAAGALMTGVGLRGRKP